MDNIVVAKLFRLGKDGDKFSKKFKTEMRSNVKIDRDYVAQFNYNQQTLGQFYEVDEKATAERQELLFPKPEKKAGRPKKEDK